MTNASREAVAKIETRALVEGQAGLWPLGQAGFIVRQGSLTAAIDPYLSDSVARVSPAFSRAFAAPIAPEDLKVGLFLVTHDHLDHLDPDTIRPYRHKETTCFVAPRLACRKLESLGVPPDNIVRVDAGESTVACGARVQGVYAVPTGPDVLDTCGYRLELPGGKSIYHSSDTAWSPLLERAAPSADVLLVCINGKFGNLNAQQAVNLARAVRPKIAVPMHYDLMQLNAENPETFIHFLRGALPECEGRILQVMEPLIW